TSEQLTFSQASLVVGAHVSTFVSSPGWSVLAIVLMGSVVIASSYRYPGLEGFRWSGRALIASSLYYALAIWPDEPGWLLLPLATLVYACTLHRFQASSVDWLSFAALL